MELKAYWKNSDTVLVEPRRVTVCFADVSGIPPLLYISIYDDIAACGVPSMPGVLEQLEVFNF